MRKKIKQLDFTDVEENWVSHSIEGYYCLETEVRQLEYEHNELLGKTEDLERKLKIAVDSLRSIEKTVIVSNLTDDEAQIIVVKTQEALDQIKGES